MAAWSSVKLLTSAPHSKPITQPGVWVCCLIKQCLASWILCWNSKIDPTKTHTNADVLSKCSINGQYPISAYQSDGVLSHPSLLPTLSLSYLTVLNFSIKFKKGRYLIFFIGIGHESMLWKEKTKSAHRAALTHRLNTPAAWLNFFSGLCRHLPHLIPHLVWLDLPGRVGQNHFVHAIWWIPSIAPPTFNLSEHVIRINEKPRGCAAIDL